MTAPITAQIKDGDNAGTLYTFTVKKYADYLLSHTDAAEYAKAAPLVKAMLNYGAYAQEYFSYNTETLANDGLSEADKALGVVSIPDTFKYNAGSTSLPDGVKFEGATLSLKSETTLSLYFTGLTVDTKFTCNGKTVETAKNGSYVVARIRGIKAEELENSFTVTFKKGNEDGSVTYSPMTYCYNVLKNETTDEKLKNVCRALYLYGEGAVLYQKALNEDNTA